MTKRTEIVFILDRSGSMNRIKDDAIGGYNSFIKDQLALDGEERVRLVLFDDKVEIFEGLHELDEKTYVPRGATALLDAIGIGVADVKESLSLIDSDEEVDVIVAIMTDGQENASKEYTKQAINEIISEQTEKGWQFIFLGANIDAVGTARDLGINEKFAGGFIADSKGMGTAMLNANEMVMSYRSTGEMKSYEDVATSLSGSEDKDQKAKTSKHTEKEKDGTTRNLDEDAKKETKRLNEDRENVANDKDNGGGK